MRAARSSRTRILGAAERLFAEHGFRRVTVRDICRAARVNVAAVNYHFGDKLGLYQEVMQAAIDAMRAATDEARRAGDGKPAEQRLRGYLTVMVGRLLAAGRGPVHRLVHRELNDPTPALDRLVERGVRPRVLYLSRLVAEILGCAVGDERVRRCVFSIQSQTLAAVPNPIAERLGFHPRPADAAAIADHIARFSLSGMRGLGRRPARPLARGRPGRRRLARTSGA
ncbi:MAG: TetR/AcrR family transcriptional regulator [Betaproteobacteria bacterium]